MSPRDVVAACLPDPAGLGDRMHGKTCAGTWVTGTRQGRGAARRLPVPRGGQRLVLEGVRLAGGGLADRDQPDRRAELLARGTWSGTGVLGPEAFEPKPFLDLLAEYGSPWGMREEPAPVL